MHKAYWQSVDKMHSGSTTLPFQIVLRASVFAAALMTMAVAQALPLDSVNSSECVRGDCENGKGTLELKTDFGKGMYRGEFLNGKFHGKGRLEIPVSFLEKSIYVGDWDEGIRSGRGTYWNGDGKLYIGQWSGDKRNGHGSYFFGLPRWERTNTPSIGSVKIRKITQVISLTTIIRAKAPTVGRTGNDTKVNSSPVKNTVPARSFTQPARGVIKCGNTAVL